MDAEFADDALDRHQVVRGREYWSPLVAAANANERQSINKFGFFWSEERSAKGEPVRLCEDYIWFRNIFAKSACFEKVECCFVAAVE